MRMNRTLGVCGLAVAALLAAGAVGGCSLAPYEEGGSGFSIDQHIYASTAELPITVMLEDTRTKEVLWTVEVPVGQKVAIRFSTGYYGNSASFPDQMRWDLMPATQSYGGLSSEMAVPHARVLKTSYREPGEFPPASPKKAKAAEVVVRD